MASNTLRDFIPLKYLIAASVGVGVIFIKYKMGGNRFRIKAFLDGKTVIVTGANSGIGEATACELAKHRARIILACRDVGKANETVRSIRRKTREGELVVRELDLASFDSIRKFAEGVCAEEARVDVLINNGGVYCCPYMETQDGLEMQMGVNHFGPFLLTNLLLDKLKRSSPSRVVVVSSGLHKLGKINFDDLNSKVEYNREAAYRNSKLASNLFARELAKRTKGSGVSVYCLHPGMARTNLGRYMEFPLIMKVCLYPLYWLLVKSAWEACQTVLYCALAEELEGESGHYYGNCKEEPWTDVSLDDATAEQLWEVSEKITHLK